MTYNYTKHDFKHYLSPEKKVLPGFVVIASLVYFGVAAKFFLEQKDLSGRYELDVQQTPQT